MKGRELNGPPEPTTASGPADVRLRKSPPRSSAPGPTSEVLAPKRHMRSSLRPPQFGARRRQRHPLRHPLVQVPDHVEGSPRRFAILARAGEQSPTTALLLQSVVPLSGPASGVPVAPICHSALVGSRLPALAHASCAWNHVMFAAGITAGRLTA